MPAPIAIIGLAVRFPGARNAERFWDQLCAGHSAIGPVPAERWGIGAADDASVNADELTSAVGGFIDAVRSFDADFFGISAPEAQAMDPQQRLFLEVAWEALEDACLNPAALAGTSTGVFVGVASSGYGSLAYAQTGLIGRHTNAGLGLGLIANRLSYFLDLRGPSLAIESACASSAQAIHQACLSLWSEESEAAIVGGANLMLTPGPSIGLARSGLLSVDGCCRVFDAAAAGCVRGEGVAAVVLKPLASALDCGDPIYAVIRGSASNHNGRGNGLTGPSRWAQEALLRRAYEQAQIEPDRVQYVEAHSTATLIGDATELAALGAVLGAGRRPEQPCIVGSLKGNVGHLESAAGVAGLIKVALMIKHRRLPPTLHYQTASPYVDLTQSRLRVQRGCSEWSCARGSAVAGVSAASYGGANVHIVLADAPGGSGRRAAGPEAGPHLLALSAKTRPALRELARCYAEWLGNHPDASLPDLCRSANMGRIHFNHRVAVLASDRSQLLQRLRAVAAGSTVAGVACAEVLQSGGERDLMRQPIGSGNAARCASAWAHGEAVDLAPLSGSGERIHALPSYPFERQSHWLAAAAPDAATPSISAAAPEQAPQPPRGAAHGMTCGQGGGARDAAEGLGVDTPATRVRLRPRPLNSPYVPAARELEQRLVAIWQELLGIVPIGVQDVFFDLGGDSAQVLQLFVRIEQEFGVVLPLTVFYSAATIERLATVLREGAPGMQWRSLVALNEAGSRTPFFFMPGIGGQAFPMRSFAVDLDQEQPLYLLTPPGFNPREAPLHDLRQIAAGFVRELRAVQPQGPYRLGGYSFGGSVAFEVACQLQAQGDSVELLVLIDAHAPGSFRKRPLLQRALAHARLVSVQRGARWNYLRTRADRLWQRLRLAAVGGRDNQAAAQVSVVANAVRRVADASSVAWQQYRPGIYRGDAVLFRASELDEFTGLFCVADPCNGWRAHIRGELEIIEMHCRHVDLFHGTALEQLRIRLRALLQSARAAPVPQVSEPPHPAAPARPRLRPMAQPS